VRAPDQPFAFESHPGAASAPLPGGYRRREPENTVLYQVVLDHLEEFLREMRGQDEHGFGLPRFVEQEFRKFLDCGVLARGFSRARCPACGFEILCAFSCKRRGICPSCSTRRMHDTAAHLVDRVLPKDVAHRQWVLSLPRHIRLLLARDNALVDKVLRIFLRAVFAWQRRRARRLGISSPECAAVTAIQRFSGAASLNVHFHSILPDGVFTIGDHGASYHPLPAPTDDEVLRITLKIKTRVEKLVERRTAEPDDVEYDPLALAQAESVRAKFPARPDDVFDPHPRRRCAFMRGFSLHADVRIHENDRLGLERLCRYVARPALALERLSQLPDGRIRYALKRPAKAGGPLEIVLTPLELMHRLATLVPPPKVNLLRYHGALAPNCKFRPLIVPDLPVEPDGGPGARCRRNEKTAAATDEPTIVAASAAGDDRIACRGPGRGAATGENGAGGRGDGPLVPGLDRAPASLLARHLDWAQLLARVYGVDVLACARCGGRMRIIAFLTESDVTRKILDHLGLPSGPPEPRRARSRDPTLFAGWGDEMFVDPAPGFFDS
jgi:hypothetical protein